MNKYHKHEGVESNGKLKSHPIARTHKDKKVQKWHVQSLKQKTLDVVPKKTSKKSAKKKVKGIQAFFGDKKEKKPENIDADGYLAIDLEKVDAKGVRILGAEKGKIWFAEKGGIKGIQFDK